MNVVHSISKQLKLIGLLVIGLLIANVSFAQNTENEHGAFQLEEEESDIDETVKVTRKVSSVSKGYRIQIYSGADRAAAKATKISFMKRFPSVRSYISYEVPYYKIKVGDFKTRKDAMDFHRYLSKTYSTTIVPSLINNRIPPKYKPPVETATEEQTENELTEPAN